MRDKIGKLKLLTLMSEIFSETFLFRIMRNAHDKA